MPPRRNPRRQAQESGSSDSDDSIDIAHTHAVKRPRPKPSKKVETAHDHTVIKTFSDYRSKRGGARQPDYGDEGDEDWSETRTRRTGGRGKKEVKEVKAEVLPFAGEEASTYTASSSSTALSSPVSELPNSVSSPPKIGPPTGPTESSMKVNDGGTAHKQVSAKAMEDRKMREKMLSALEGRMRGDWKGKTISKKLRRQYGFWGGA
ncbi:hypothetical protein EHS25_003248 [Saitozyma podzolica]|uniref:Uncharacterized protein n=1 Tax=Saitozyma podzolica TaxID=1890683 RepID=A0A427Y8B9_9TREE|nr:hypothetical protein EHS25_003248 [Saitozyma podzolica]